MKLYEKRENCTGCMACKNVCIHSAINIKIDQEGFSYPQIDEAKCISCKRCIKVCPIYKEASSDSLQKAFAVKAIDDRILEQSSSGGVFYYISKEILARNGVIFGAAVDSDLVVRHRGVDTVEELKYLMGSKYVQSDLGDSFKQIRERLLANQQVMFVGTPCQVAGLKSYLGGNYESLITVDLICHGVPSPKVYSEYLNYLQRKFDKKIENIIFRSKQISWENFSLSVRFEDHTEWSELFKDNLYGKCFLDNIFLRPSCYGCHFKRLDRNSDITLGDYWGIQSDYPDFYCEKGVSLCCVHSKKGLDLFSSIAKYTVNKEVDLHQAISHNPAYLQSVSLNRMRSIFFSSLMKKPIEKNMQNSINPSIMTRIILKLRNWKQLRGNNNE